jgi:hypothetical protein
LRGKGKRRRYLPFRMTWPPDWFRHCTRLKKHVARG